MMKYLKKYNESLNSDIIETVNDICLELSDLGFYSDRNGQRIDDIFIQPAHGIFKYKNSLIGFYNGRTFLFDDIKEYIYRIKDVVGINNIETFNYHISGNREYTRCDMSKLKNESLDIKNELTGVFMVFNFPVIELGKNDHFLFF